MHLNIHDTTTERFMDRLVQELRRRREAKGISQEALNDRIGVADCLVAKWETGQKRPSPRYVWLWAEALDAELVLVFR